MAGKFYVYILARPNGVPFYVGKGTGRRMYRHDAEARNNCDCHKCRVIRKVWRDGGDVLRRIVFRTDDEAEAFAREKELIATIGQAALTNETPGGEGSAELMKKWANDPRMRALRKTKTQRLWSSPSHREKVAAVYSDPEFKARMSAANKAVWSNPEHKAKMSAIHQVRLSTPEAKARQSAASKARGITAETRAKMVATRVANYANDPDIRARRSAAMRASWARRKGEANEDG